MPDVHSLLRWFGAVVGLCALTLVGVALLPSAATAQDEAPQLRVLNHHCDDRGGIDALLIQVPTLPAKPVVLHWDNHRICGDAT